MNELSPHFSGSMSTMGGQHFSCHWQEVVVLTGLRYARNSLKIKLVTAQAVGLATSPIVRPEKSKRFGIAPAAGST